MYISFDTTEYTRYPTLTLPKYIVIIMHGLFGRLQPCNVYMECYKCNTLPVTPLGNFSTFGFTPTRTCAYVRP